MSGLGEKHAYAVCWEDRSTCDVILNIVIGDAEDAAVTQPAGPSGSQPPAKRHNRGPTAEVSREATMAAADAVAAASGGRCLFLHSLILSVHSEYFKARLHPSSATSGMRGDDSGGDGPLKLLTEHVVSAEDAEALQAVVRFAYCQLLRDVVPFRDVAALLGLVELSDRCMMLCCMRAAMAELASCRGADYDTPSAVKVFLDGLPPGAQLSPHAASIQSIATHHVMQRLAAIPAAAPSDEHRTLLHSLRLDDAEAMCAAVCRPPHDQTSRTFHQLLRCLRFEALLCLLQGRLTARSENSVLMMVDAWVAAQQVSPPAAPDHRVSHFEHQRYMQSMYQHQCRLQQQESQQLQLAAALRLGGLSRAFTFEVLGRIPWLHLSPRDVLAIARFATSSPAHQATLLRYRDEGLPNPLPGPRGWYEACRTDRPAGGPAKLGDSHSSSSSSSSDPMSLAWDLSEAVLQEALEQTRSGTRPPGSGTVYPSSPCFFFNGFSVRVGLVLAADRSSCHITSDVSIGGSMYPSALIECDVRLRINEGEVLTLGDPIPTGSFDDAAVLHSLGQGDALDIKSWAPYFAEGWMRVTGSIHRCE